MANAESFRIEIDNGTQGEIKITKFEYQDGSKWKTENMFGIDGHQKLELDRGMSWFRNLQGIGGETTQFRVSFRVHRGGNEWGRELTQMTERFTAQDRGEMRITLTE